MTLECPGRQTLYLHPDSMLPSQPWTEDNNRLIQNSDHSAGGFRP